MENTIIYYSTERGKCPVERFIEARSLRKQAKLFAFLTWFAREGSENLSEYITARQDEISTFQVPLAGKHAQIFYFFHYQDSLVFTHGFAKTVTQKPAEELKKAQKYREKFLRRIQNEWPRQDAIVRTFQLQLKKKLDNPEFLKYYQEYCQKVIEK